MRRGWLFMWAAVWLAVPAGAHAWPARPLPAAQLPEPRTWDLLPVVAREGRYRAFAFDGHVHTSHSHDADHTTENVVALAGRVGLDALVITDHGSSHAARDLARSGHEGSPAVLVGEEVGGSFGHSVIWNVPDRRGVGGAAAESMEALGTLVHRQGGLVVLAHPGWWIHPNHWDPRRWMQYDALRRGGIGQQIDAIEIWNQVYYQPTRRLLDEWDGLLARGLFVPIVGGSDFHGFPEHDLGLPRTVVLCPEGRAGEPIAIPACILEAVPRGRAYVTDGPTLSMTVSGRTFGSLLPVVAGAPLVVSIRAHAPQGGTLEIRVGTEIRERIALPAGTEVSRRVLVLAPTTDSFVRAEVARAEPIPHRTPFSLLSNPILLDVPPFHTGDLRGPDQGRIPAPRGFSRPEVERARLRAEAREARRRVRERR